MPNRKSYKKEKVEEPLKFQKLLNYTLWLLGRRNHHSSELKQKLRQKGASQEQIQQILQKLINLNYLNDSSYITSYLQSELARKPQGLYRLKQKLLQKRIPLEEIENALESFPYNEEEQIKKALSKKGLTSSGSLNKLGLDPSALKYSAEPDTFTGIEANTPVTKQNFNADSQNFYEESHSQSEIDHPSQRRRLSNQTSHTGIRAYRRFHTAQNRKSPSQLYKEKLFRFLQARGFSMKGILRVLK